MKQEVRFDDYAVDAEDWTFENCFEKREELEEKKLIGGPSPKVNTDHTLNFDAETLEKKRWLQERLPNMDFGGLPKRYIDSCFTTVKQIDEKYR